MRHVAGSLLDYAQSGVLRSCVLAGCRCDGRGLSDGRQINIQFSGAERGRAQVEMGDTRVLCSVAGEVVAPSADRPYDGFVSFHVDLSPMASEFYDPFPSVHSATYSQASEMAVMIETMLRRSRAIDTEGLYIEGGSKVWSLSITIHVLDNDGNVLDAAALAALAGLLHFRRNKELEYRGTSIDAQRLPSTPLSLHHMPVLVTLAFMEGSNDPIFIVDPTRQEETVSTGQMSVAVNQFQELCGMRKSGKQLVDAETLHHAIRVASARASTIIDTLMSALKLHEEEREVRRRDIWNTYNSAECPAVTLLEAAGSQALLDAPLAAKDTVGPTAEAEKDKPKLSNTTSVNDLPRALGYVAARVAGGHALGDVRNELREQRRNVEKHVNRKQKQKHLAQRRKDTTDDSAPAVCHTVNDITNVSDRATVRSQAAEDHQTSSQITLDIPNNGADDFATGDFTSAVLPQQQRRKRSGSRVKKRKI